MDLASAGVDFPCGERWSEDVKDVYTVPGNMNRQENASSCLDYAFSVLALRIFYGHDVTIVMVANRKHNLCPLSR